jgi:hypothetical protein
MESNKESLQNKRKKILENPPNLTPPNSLAENNRRAQGTSHQQLSAKRKKKRSVAKSF